MKKPYQRPAQDVPRHEGSRGHWTDARPPAFVTVNCDIKKSILPNSLDVLFQFNYRR
jgi:hypothetical protein